MHSFRSRVIGTLMALMISAAAAIAPTGVAQAYTMGGLHARLHPTSAYGSAHGGAWYEQHCCWREFSIHIRGIPGLAGKRVTVTVHRTVVGRMRISSSGSGHLYRRHGMPRCGSGDRVRVRTGTGVLVSYGTLRRHPHMMMR